MGEIEGNGNPTPEQRDVARLMDDWQHRAPAGPDFTQPTIDYVNEGVALALERAMPLLKAKLPENSTEIDEKLGNAELVDTDKWKLIPGFQVTRDDLKNITSMRMMVPNRPGEYRGKWIPADIKSEINGPLLTTLADLDPRLGVGEYVLALKFPQPREISQTSKDFTLAFNRIRAIIGEDISLTDPRLQVIAAAYIIQVAKGKVVDATKALINQAQGLENQPGLTSGVIDNIQKKVDAIHVHEKYLIVAKGILNAFAEKIGFAPEQMQLLYDIAFMKKDELSLDRGAGAYEMLVKNVFAENPDWLGLFAQRDFLVRYVGDAFPSWRQRIMREQVGGEFSNSFEELLAALSADRISEENVPKGLLDLKAVAKSYFEKEILVHRINVVKATEGISREIVTSLPLLHNLPTHNPLKWRINKNGRLLADDGIYTYDIGERLYIYLEGIDTKNPNWPSTRFFGRLQALFYSLIRNNTKDSIIDNNLKLSQLTLTQYLREMLPDYRSKESILEKVQELENLQ